MPSINDFVGTWHIVDMEMWDADYFNMEGQAYLHINEDGLGDVQFGLVNGRIDGNVDASADCFRFTWNGRDEMDSVHGSGRLDCPDNGEATGMIKFHMGDRSAFRVVKSPDETGSVPER